MEKVKIQGFGNEENFYYFIIKNKEYTYDWLLAFTTLIKSLSSSAGLRGLRFHDEEEIFEPNKMLDKHEAYSADNARIDVFYGKQVIYIGVYSNSINKNKIL